MQIYTVYEPPDPPADRLDRAEAHAFVKEGFTWMAFLLTPLWLLANRMWLILATYVLGLGALQLGLAWIGAEEQLRSLLVLAAHLLIGFEADTLKRWTLERKGWRMIGSVAGRNWLECERRFFEAWLPEEPYIRAEALTPHGGSLPLVGAMQRRQGRWPFPLAPRS